MSVGMFAWFNHAQAGECRCLSRQQWWLFRKKADILASVGELLKF
jgi:hypothetical protein